MKKSVLIALVTVLLTLLFLFSGCTEEKADKPKLSHEEAIALVNANCDTPLKLATPSGQLNKENLNEEPGFGCYVLSNDDVRYTVSGYPDVVDAYHLTDILLSSDKYHIFGITLGHNFDEAVKQFESFGFEEDKELYEEHTGRYNDEPQRYKSSTMELSGVIINISSTNDRISGLKLMLATTNKNNVVF